MKKTLAFLLFSASTASIELFAADDLPETLDEVIVTSTGIKQAASRSSRPVTVLEQEKLRTQIGQTIGETLQNELGVTSQSFGAGVGSPVIRGQGGPRVRVLQNSIGNNDASSLSPDHANGVEPIIAERIEVLRGPSTLLYGNGAIGGIVNVIDNRIPERLPDKIIGGAGEQRYDSATDESASAIKLEGGKDFVAFHVDGFYRDQNITRIGGEAIDEAAVRQHDPSFNSIPPGGLINTDGFIGNSQARSRGGSAGLSLIGQAGLTGAAINSLEKVYGIPPDGHGEAPVTVDLTQTKYDFKGQLNSPFEWMEQAQMKFGYTDYKHVERDGGIPGTTFLNQTYESRLELEQKPIGRLTGVTGFQSINSVFEGLGEEGEIVPKSDIASYAVFAVESLTSGAMTYELGARAEWQQITPDDRDRVKFVPLSGSASALWQMTDQHQLSLAFTHSQRAPQIQELFSDGFHHATRSYEIGNPNLNKEASNNLDFGYQYHSDWVALDVNLFHNWVADYIYQQRSSTLLYNEEDGSFVSPNSACDECFPVLNTDQTNAIFKGFEAQAKFPLMANHYGLIDLTLFGDYTRGTFDNGSDVPRMPPLRYGFQIDYEQNDWAANIRLTRAQAQTHPGDNETSTDGYLLLNLGAEYHLAGLAESEVLLFAKGKNLLNENIRNSTSYLRNFAPEPGRGAEIGIRIDY